MERSITDDKLRCFENSLIMDEKSSSTIDKYIRDVRSMMRYFGSSQLSKQGMMAYKRFLMENYSAASVNSMLASANSFLKFMGWYDCTVKAMKVQRQVFRAKERELTRGEYYRLLYTARRKNKIRLYLLMQTICSTGIRVSELPFISVEAVRKGKAEVRLKGKTRQVLLPKSLVRELSAYIHARGIKSGSVFVTRSGKAMDRSNILHEMKALCDAAGVEKSKVFPHNLRHLFACSFYKAEKDLGRLADILGHSSVDTTRIYTSTSGLEQRKQLEKLGLVLEKKQLPHNNHYAVILKCS